MIQLLFTSACLISCVLCNSYLRPSYGPENVGGVATTGPLRDGGGFFGRRAEGSAFAGLVSGRRGDAVFGGQVSGQKRAGVFGERGTGFGFGDLVTGRGVGSDSASRFRGRNVGPRINDDFVTGRVDRRWRQGSSGWTDRRDDSWRDTRGSQWANRRGVRPEAPVRSYN
ncbi:uncharacterized protein LOC132548950 [Ylistrum balloti]|uniref:uncharacterized protein LOC132548950 n=1 Tax=Ylistrum balloti TaxID=509963 RepID=UPI0029057DD6|nr:uncharacterized protein LOC132548950 [Ylistrum balloti]